MSEAETDPAAPAVRTALVADLDAGFADLVRAYQGIAYSVALRLTGRPADAEDLAAESFLRAYRALRGYDAARIHRLRPRPWLLTIVRNTARNAAREASRRPGPPPAFEPVEPQASGVEGNDLRGELVSALAELPEVQRAAVVLRHVVGLSTTEVADVLGCPNGTAKSHISRGLARLRTLTAKGALS